MATGSGAMVAWGWELGEGITNEHEESLEMMETFIILMVMRVSQVCAYGKICQIAHFKYIQLCLNKVVKKVDKDLNKLHQRTSVTGQ